VLVIYIDYSLSVLKKHITVGNLTDCELVWWWIVRLPKESYQPTC